MSEPILTGTIAITLCLAWALIYSWQSGSTGDATRGPYIFRVLAGTAVFAVPVSLWTGFAIAGGFLVRRRGFGFRLLTAWMAALALCAPFVIAAFMSLSVSDGWRGLGVISFGIPLVAPFVVVTLYCVAAGMLRVANRSSRRRAVAA